MIKLSVLKKYYFPLDQTLGGEMKSQIFSLAVILLIFTQAVLGAEKSKSSQRALSQSKASSSANLRVNSVKTKSAIGTSGLESLYGFLEFRPSYTSVQGEIHTENTAEVGYKIAPTLKTGYVQYFSTNLMSNLGTTLGLNPTANDGFAYFKAKDVWQSPDKHLSASYQLRLLTPTDPSKAQAGYITSFRNQFLLTYKFNELVSVDLSYHPILHAYSKAGITTSKGTLQANPGSDHQFVLQPTFHPTSQLTVLVPVVYQVTHFKQMDGASNSSAWRKLVTFWPEIDYEINPMHTVGIAYYTDNLISDYGSGLNLSNGFRNGVTQLVWGINL